MFMQWYKYNLFFLFFLISSSTMAQESATPKSIAEKNLPNIESLNVSGNETPWAIISDSEGIKTYRKEVPGSEVFPLKGITILNAPIEKVLTLMLDDKGHLNG